MALEGTLNYLDIAHLFQVVGAAQKSGVMEVWWQDRKARLLFERGDLTCAQSSARHEGIGTLLVRAGHLSPADLDGALARQAAEGPGARRLGAILCDDFGVRPEDMERLLLGQFQKIALDVFSWPGGRFVFEFQEPREAWDRFRLNASDFIVGVGIRAGFLAEKGLEVGEERTDRAHLVFLDGDQGLLGRLEEHWQRKGHRVTCCATVSAARSALEECSPCAVLLADWGAPGSGRTGAADALRLATACRPEVPTLVFSEDAGEESRRAAAAAGARAFVKKPGDEDLGGPLGDVHFGVFMMALERALGLGLRCAGAAPCP
jgi:CheY-like chemotaxis protein